MNNTPLQKEDYEEPCCPLNMKPNITRIPIKRVMEKLDEYFSRNDYVSAENHLSYWLKEADAGNDMRGKLTILNEQIGLYRKVGKEKECMDAIDSVLSLSSALKIENTVSFGTTLVNAATGKKSFGKNEEALALYEKAKVIYESNLDSNDSRLGGLYNNMALALTETGKYREAETLFYKALEVMSKQQYGEMEMAITYLNLADLVYAELGAEASEEKIGEYIEKAEQLLDTDSLPRSGYYAFVCEKCAPTFGYYGYFLTQQKFAQRAREIYERS